MDTQTARETIGHQAFLNEIERLLRDESSPCSEGQSTMLRAVIQGLQEHCWIRSCFVARLWRAMNERWEARMGRLLPSAACCLPERGEMEEILRQACDGSVERPLSDAVFLDAVETLLREAPRQRDIVLTYGETILKLWSDQMIRFRFLECLGPVIHEGRRVRTTGDHGTAGLYLPERDELERLLKQTAFEWVEERRRSLAAKPRWDEERHGSPAVLSFS